MVESVGRIAVTPFKGHRNISLLVGDTMGQGEPGWVQLRLRAAQNVSDLLDVPSAASSALGTLFY